MNRPITSSTDVLAPISQDWTIAELVEWLADDSRTHDAALQHPLALIEAAVTGATWPREPSTVALIRSLASAAVRHGALRIGDLPAFRSRSVPLIGTGGGTNRDRSDQSDAAGARMPVPQVA